MRRLFALIALSASLAHPMNWAAAQTVPAYGIKTRPAVGAYFDGKVKVIPTQPLLPMMAVNAFPNLTFQNPMGMVQMPGTTWLVVWEREGTVRAFEKDPKSAASTLLLDISSRTQGWDDCGIMSLVFHPQFSLANATNRYVYIWYTYNPPGTLKGSAAARPAGYPNVASYNRLSRFDVDEFGIILPDSELVMIHQKCKTVWHKGGGMFFHPSDGFLYLSVGEDFDAKTNAQLINNSLLGGILRIDVDMKGPPHSHPIPKQPFNGETKGYFIPNDNPLVGVPNALEEFYAIGLRSPDEMTLDAASGRIFISDVGDYGVRGREEINVINPGEVAANGLLNFEWDKKVGTAAVTGTADGERPVSGRYVTASFAKPPLLEYTHADNSAKQVAAVMGGYVYRGAEQATALGGKYVFADNMSGKIWTLDESGAAAKKVLIALLPDGPGINRGQNYLGISSFALDAAGELYLCRLSNEGGGIFKLVPNTTLPPGLPPKLSSTGLFTSMSARTVSTKLVPYTVNHPFWSDGANKYRWAAIPSDTSVGYSPQGEWTFPEGSVFVKHFDLPISDVTPTTVRRLETRVIVKTATGIYGGSYKWQSDKLNANLVQDTSFENIKVAIRSAGTTAAYNLGGTTLPAGTSSQSSTKLTIYGSGTGVGGTSDQCRFNYIKRKGDFDFFVRVEKLVPSIGGTTPLARVGLMVRKDFLPTSQAVAISAGMSNEVTSGQVSDFLFHTRSESGQAMTATPPSEPVVSAYPALWLRLCRAGDVFIGYVSTNGIDWNETGRTTLALGSTSDLLWGVTCSAQEPPKRAAAVVYFQTARIQRWTFPGTSACSACHDAASGWVLGLNTRQINCTYTYPATKVKDNQLRSWAHSGLLGNGPADVDLPTLDKLSPVTDVAASLESKARSYLDVNCATCHRPGGVQALWDARWETPLASQGIINGVPLKDLGITGAKIVAPGDPAHSLIHYRVNALGGHQMPPLGRNRVDAAGVKLLEQWISSLQP